MIENANQFDISREHVQHVSFGYGIRLCLGLHLARLEARVAVNRLLDTFPDMTLAEQSLECTGSALVRGLDYLVIETSRRAVP